MTIKNSFRKTLLLITLGLNVLALSLVFVFYKQTAFTAQAWYNSSWLYRKPITINNTGSVLTNEDVLITLDTASLISTGKLQNDCDDLRFTNTDDTTILTYWIESGCNTTNTQIWIRIPSVPTGDKIIYMYYGNTTATAGELSWNGNFVAITDQSSCPTGWSRVTSLDGRFPQGSTSSGTTGGASTHTHTYTANVAHTHSPGTLTTASAGAHTHQINYSTYPSGAGLYPYGVTTIGSWVSGAVSTSGAHTHTISGATASAGTGSSATMNSTDSLPPFLDVLFCSPDVQQFSEVPANLVFLFDDTISLSKSYSRFSALDSKFPRGSSTYGTTGGSTTHSHTYSTVLAHTHGIGTLATVSNGSHTHSLRYENGPSGSYPYLDGEQTIGNWIYNAVSTTGAHTHTLSGSVASAGVASPSTQSANSIPPYLTMFYEKLTTTQEDIDPHTISMVTTSNPPLGWTRYSALDNKFAMGSTTYGTTGGATTHSHVYTDVPAHTHSVGTLATASAGDHTHDLRGGGGGGYSPYISTSATGGTWQGGSDNVETAGAHTHTFTGATASSGTTNPSTDSISNIPPYMTVIYSQKKHSLGTTTANEEFYNNVPTKPTNLFTEGQNNPVEVTDTTPEFSAIFNDPDIGDTAIYYEIIVSTANDLDSLSNPVPIMPEGMIWDSGKSSITATAIGSRSPEISYAGDPLPLNGQTLYWRIRFWDQNDADGAWSDTATLQMTLKPAAVTNPYGEALSPNTIRWYFTDNAVNEEGIRIYDANNVLIKTCIGENLTYCDEGGLQENFQYSRKITAYTSQSESDFSATASRYTLLSTPLIPIEISKATNEISISISSLPNSPEYFVECQSDCTGNVNIWTTSLTANITNLLSNTPYTFRLKARNGDLIETAYSEALKIYTYAEVPTLTVNRSTNTVITLGVFNVNNPVSGQSGLYFECVDTNCNSGIQEWTKNIYDVAGDLLPNTSYNFRVMMRNYDGILTEWSTLTTAVTLASEPTISEINNIDEDTITLKIQNADNPSTTELRIQETTTGKYLNTQTSLLQIDPYWVPFENIPSNININGLTAGTSYTFEVIARNTNNIETPYSGQATAITKLALPIPDLPNVTDTTITWNIKPYPTDTLGIKVYDTADNLITTCSGTNITSCTETGLTPNTQYTRNITVFDDISESNYTRIGTVTTLATQPSLNSIQSGEYTHNSTVLHINPEANPANTLFQIKELETKKYLNVQTRFLEDLPYETTFGTYDQFGRTNGITVYGLQPNTQYTFAILARNSNGTSTQFSPSQSVRTLAEQPEIVEITAIDNTSLRIVIDSVNNPTGTELLLQEKNSKKYLDPTIGMLQTEPIWKDTTNWGSINGITVKNLTTNTLYTFCIKAKNLLNIETSCSKDLSKYTKSITPSMTTRVVSASSIEIAVNIDGNPISTQYQIIDTKSNGYIDSNGKFTNTPSPITSNSTINKITLGSLPPNTNYIFRARTQNKDNVLSDLTTTSSITTWANTPIDFVINNIGGTTAKLKFNSNGNPNYTQYAIQESKTGQYVDYSTHSLIDTPVWGTYASWGTADGISISGLNPENQYSFRVKARNSDNVETSFTDGNTGKTYSIILNKPEDISTTLSSNQTIDVSKIEGAQEGIQNIRVSSNKYIIADIPISFDQNRDWSNAILQNDPTSRKTVVKINSTHGFSDKFTLYVVTGDSNAFRICPDAMTLEDVNSTCSNSVLFSGDFPQSKLVENSTVTVSKAQIGGITYWISDGLKGTGGEGEIIIDSRSNTQPKISERFSKAVEGVVASTVNALDQTPLAQLEKEELTTVAATTTVVTITVGVTSAAGGFGQLGYGIAQFFVNILNTLGFRRKKYPSGYVYNAVSREPLSQAVVRIFDKTHKLITTAVTDANGIFWCDIEDGEYKLEVKYKQFSFPSQLILGKEDYPMTGIYHGEITTLKKGEIQIVIPVDPQETKESNKILTMTRGVLSSLIPIINTVLFITGIIITIYVYTRDPKITNLLVGILYIPATFVFINGLFKQNRRYGRVTYEDKTSASNITIILKDAEFDKVTAKRVTDDRGRYSFDIKEKGIYTLELLKGEFKIIKGNTQIISEGNMRISNNLVIKRV